MLPFGRGAVVTLGVSYSCPIFTSSRDFDYETAIWDSLAWSYGWKRLAEVLHRQWNVFQDGFVPPACALRTRPPERLTPDVQLHQFCATDARRRRAIAFGGADTTQFLAPEHEKRVKPLFLQGLSDSGDTVLRREFLAC
jgi:hypothetical protein